MDEITGTLTAHADKQHNSTLKHKVVGAVFWLGATKALGQTISWIITIYVARVLSPDDYGLMGMSWIFIGFVALFNEVGLGSAIIQNKSLNREELSGIYWLIMIINTALYVVSFLAAPLMASLFNEPKLTSILRVIALNFVIAGIGFIPYNLLTKEIDFNKRSRAEFVGNLCGGVATLVFAVMGHGVWSLAYGSITVTAASNIMFCLYYPWRPDFVLSLSKIRNMIRFGAKIAVTRLLWYVYSNSDFMIAGKLLGKTLLGYYSLAFQFASIPMEKIISTLTQIAYPAFSEIQNDEELLRRYFLKTVRLVAFATFPVFLGIMLVSEDAVYLFLTEKWSPIILPLQVLCVASTLRAVNSMNAPLVVAKGRPNIAIISNLIFAIGMPVAFYAGSFYGLKGLSYAWLFAFPVLFAVTSYMAAKTIRLPFADYLKEFRHATLATISMVALVMLFQRNFGMDSRALRLALTAVTGAASYCAYHVIFNREIFSEARSLLKR